MKDEFAVLGAELITPSFTRGRKQLSAEDVSHSRLTSNVRIHIGKYYYYYCLSGDGGSGVVKPSLFPVQTRAPPGLLPKSP